MEQNSRIYDTYVNPFAIEDYRNQGVIIIYCLALAGFTGKKRKGMLCKMKRTRPKFFFPFLCRFSFQDEGSFLKKKKKDYETRSERMDRHCAGWGVWGEKVCSHVQYICKSMAPPLGKKYDFQIYR